MYWKDQLFGESFTWLQLNITGFWVKIWRSWLQFSSAEEAELFLSYSIFKVSNMAKIKQFFNIDFSHFLVDNLITNISKFEIWKVKIWNTYVQNNFLLADFIWNDPIYIPKHKTQGLLCSPTIMAYASHHCQREISLLKSMYDGKVCSGGSVLVFGVCLV